ncbi:hypothetical protein GJ496_002797 [Pomphorhynchus laevis]|nr:hypothetical protein GJ496_002797 [Pomphorhynchus laevis]
MENNLNNKVAIKPPMLLIKSIFQTHYNFIPENKSKQSYSKLKSACIGYAMFLLNSSLVHSVVDKRLITHGFTYLSSLLVSKQSKVDKKMMKNKDDRSSNGLKGGSIAQGSSTFNLIVSKKKSAKRLNLQLIPYKLRIRDVVGDGNCLFRSLSDQMIGSEVNHLIYRKQVSEYILEYSEEFKPFFVGHQDFGNAVKELGQIGVFAGNEALVAFSRIYKVDIIIHQYNQKPWRIAYRSFHSSGSLPDLNSVLKHRPQLHICYHTYPHYSSVRWLNEPYNAKVPANIYIEGMVVNNI